MNLLLLLACASIAAPQGPAAAYEAQLEKLKSRFERRTEKLDDPDYVRDKLAHMVQLDQLTRNTWLSLYMTWAEEDRAGFQRYWNDKMTTVDRENTAELKRLIERHGWIRADRFGAQADRDAWLIAQHADAEPAFQREVLAMLEALPAGATDKKNLAYLSDRVAVGAGGLQKYGTQGACRAGRWTPAPIADEANVDWRRLEIGLKPMAEHIRSMGPCR